MANADRLIGGFSTGVYRFVGGICHLEAFTPVNPAADEMMKARFPRPIAGMWHLERAHAGEIVEFADTETEAADLPLREIARARGFRSLLYVAPDEQGNGDWRHRRQPQEPRPVFSASRRVAADFRRSGRDRHRERAAVQRDQGGAGAADRDLGGSGGHQLVAGRSEPVFEHDVRERMRVCEANFGFLQLWDGASFRSPSPPTTVAASVGGTSV